MSAEHRDCRGIMELLFDLHPEALVVNLLETETEDIASIYLKASLEEKRKMIGSVNEKFKYLDLVEQDWRIMNMDLIMRMAINIPHRELH